MSTPNQKTQKPKTPQKQRPLSSSSSEQAFHTPLYLCTTETHSLNAHGAGITANANKRDPNNTKPRSRAAEPSNHAFLPPFQATTSSPTSPQAPYYSPEVVDFLSQAFADKLWISDADMTLHDQTPHERGPQANNTRDSYNDSHSDSAGDAADNEKPLSDSLRAFFQGTATDLQQRDKTRTYRPREANNANREKKYLPCRQPAIGITANATNFANTPQSTYPPHFPTQRSFHPSPNLTPNLNRYRAHQNPTNNFSNHATSTPYPHFTQTAQMPTSYPTAAHTPPTNRPPTRKPRPRSSLSPHAVSKTYHPTSTSTASARTPPPPISPTPTPTRQFTAYLSASDLADPRLNSRTYDTVTGKHVGIWYGKDGNRDSRAEAKARMREVEEEDRRREVEVKREKEKETKMRTAREAEWRRRMGKREEEEEEEEAVGDGKAFQHIHQHQHQQHQHHQHPRSPNPTLAFEHIPPISSFASDHIAKLAEAMDTTPPSRTTTATPTPETPQRPQLPQEAMRHISRLDRERGPLRATAAGMLVEEETGEWILVLDLDLVEGEGVGVGVGVGETGREEARSCPRQSVSAETVGGEDVERKQEGEDEEDKSEVTSQLPSARNGADAYGKKRTGLGLGWGIKLW
ncbi:hypothetical protein CC80DRAFT_552738 [Byssothecium circinans]|uniref:Uncharacterized protein n=1 Tax=Byssothecium circinans TaxID=147558 RepID=A0A6A5TGK7_9PLEO|nr:hypothetical protein CC80DRAFT_552738 [Byssothecium circinans]